MEKQTKYRCFTRTWWAENPAWPNGLEPCPGRKSYARHPKNLTESEARAYCQDYNKRHNPGRYSYKAEFEEM